MDEVQDVPETSFQYHSVSSGHKIFWNSGLKDFKADPRQINIRFVQQRLRQLLLLGNTCLGAKTYPCIETSIWYVGRNCDIKQQWNLSWHKKATTCEAISLEKPCSTLRLSHHATGLSSDFLCVNPANQSCQAPCHSYSWDRRSGSQIYLVASPSHCRQFH